MSCKPLDDTYSPCIPVLNCDQYFTPGDKIHLYIKNKSNNQTYILSFRGGIINDREEIELFEGKGYELNFYSNFIFPDNNLPYPPSLTKVKLKEEGAELYLHLSLGDLSESFIFKNIDFEIDKANESNMISLPLIIKEICVEPDCCCNKININYMKGKLSNNCLFRFKDYNNNCYSNKKLFYKPLIIKTCKSLNC